MLWLIQASIIAAVPATALIIAGVVDQPRLALFTPIAPIPIAGCLLAVLGGFLILLNRGSSPVRWRLTTIFNLAAAFQFERLHQVTAAPDSTALQTIWLALQILAALITMLTGFLFYAVQLRCAWFTADEPFRARPQ